MDGRRESTFLNVVHFTNVVEQLFKRKRQVKSILNHSLARPNDRDPDVPRSTALHLKNHTSTIVRNSILHAMSFCSIMSYA
jgi:hypothetical protein